MITVTLWIALTTSYGNRPPVVLERFTEKQACLEFAARFNAANDSAERPRYGAAHCLAADKVYRP
jgi:hypothetical protein